MGLCNVSLSNKTQRYTAYLYLETALHVSGGTSTHNQEPIQLYLQHLIFVTPLLLSTANVEELKPFWVCCGWRTPPTAHSNWQIPDTVDTVVCAPNDWGKYHPKHVEQFSDINKLCNVASCWIYEYIGILLGARQILHISRLKVNLSAFYRLYMRLRYVSVLMDSWNARSNYVLYTDSKESYVFGRRLHFRRCWKVDTVFISGIGFSFKRNEDVTTNGEWRSCLFGFYHTN
jgi:hypothetical protein